MSRHVRRPAMAAMLIACLAASGPAFGEDNNGKIDLALKPPPAPQGLVCDVPPPPAVIAAKWEAWDGAALPGDHLNELRLDGKRLASLDAKKYFDVSKKIFTYLRTSRDPKIALKAGIDYARLFVDADSVTPGNVHEIMRLLSKGQAARNPTAMLILGVIHERGMGIPADPERALRYYTAAAQYGQADALIRIAQFKLNGRSVALDVDPALIGVFSFSGMLENDVPDPCAGIKRIARLYAKGTGIIQQNIPLAVEWFQLAADAGDPESAWLVARYHLLGEGVVKDNALLRKYLDMAARTGIVPAMVELARAYEDGSFVPQDKGLAKFWYERAVQAGSFPASLRLANMLGRNAPLAQETEETQARVAAQAEAPPAALVNYVQTLLTRHGREAAAEALPVLNRGVTMGDRDSLVLRAGLMAEDPGQDGLDEDMLRRLRMISENGDVRASVMLAEHYGCQGSDMPRTELAASYRRLVIDGRSNLGTLVAEELDADTAALDEAGWLERLALLRSAAMRDIPDGLALLVDSYETAPASLRNDAALAYWKTRLQDNASALWRYTRLLDRRPDEAAGLKRDLLEKAARLGSAPAASDLVKLMASEEGWNPARWQEARDLLGPGIMAGNGMALELARDLFPAEEFTRYMQSSGLFEVAAARGDSHFAAVLAAAATNETTRQGMLAIASALAGCTAIDQFRLVDLMAPGPERRKELTVLQTLAGDTAGEQYRLGRLFEANGPDGSRDALVHFQNAARLGHADAAKRVLKAYVTPGSALFSTEEVTRRVPELLASNDARQMFNAAEALHRAAGIDKASQEVEDSMKLLYAKSASLGHPAAMREYGLSLQRGSFTARDPEEAANWLGRASDAGDKVASRYMARACLLGFGVPRSLERSKAYYRRAAELGDKESKRMIERLGELSPRVLQP